MNIDTNLAKTVEINPKTSKIIDSKGQTQSFASFLDNENGTQMTNNRSLEYLDKNGAFDKLSLEDVKVFRKILSDDFISKKELKEIPFEQVQRLNSFMMKMENAQINLYVKYEDTAGAMLWNVNFAKDDKLNKALFNTIEQMKNIQAVNKFIYEFLLNVNQVLSGESANPSFIETSSSINDSGFNNIQIGEKKDIDFNSFLNNYTEKLSKLLEESKGAIDSQTYSTYKKHFDIYKNLKENYNKLS